MNGTMLGAAIGAGAYWAYRSLQPRYDFRNRHVLITGGSRGLGLLEVQPTMHPASRAAVSFRLLRPSSATGPLPATTRSMRLFVLRAARPDRPSLRCSPVVSLGNEFPLRVPLMMRDPNRESDLRPGNPPEFRRPVDPSPRAVSRTTPRLDGFPSKLEPRKDRYIPADMKDGWTSHPM